MMKVAVFLSLLGIALGDSRMIGGQVAPAAAFPYTVSFRAFALGYEDIHYCGGSIVSTKTVLTAGHCIDWLPATAIDVVFGTNTLDCKGTRYRAARTLLHPSYNDTDFTYDIGLLFTAKSFEYSATIQPIEMDWNVIGGGVPVVSMGWGRILPNVTDNSNDLKFANETSITRADCNSRMSNTPFREVQEYELCTLTPTGVGTCSGDAGGPIVVQGKVVGIIALGYQCAGPYPDVAIRVSSFRSWIEQNILE